MKKSKNVESKPTPSVIARLMGLDELRPQELVKKPKQQRVLSENYRRIVASIGVWEKKTGDEHRSFQFSIEEQEFIWESGPSLNESFAGAGFMTVGIKLQPSKEVHSGLPGLRFAGSRKDCFENHFQKPNYPTTKHVYNQEGSTSNLQAENVRLLESAYAFGCEKNDIYRKVRGTTHQEDPKLLQKLDNRRVKDSRRKYGHDSTYMVPRFRRESNNERRPSFGKIVIPNPTKVEKAKNWLASPSFSEASYSSNWKDKGFVSHGKGTLHAQVKEMKNVCNGVKHTGHRSILSCETEKEIFRNTRHNMSNISLEPLRLGFNGVHSFKEEPEFMMVFSPNNSELNNWNKPSCYYLDGSYMTLEARKQISERWRMTKDFRENGLTGRRRSRTRDDMLTLLDHGNCANFQRPLGISSRGGQKIGGVGDLIRSISPAYSTYVESSKIMTDRKAFHGDSYITMGQRKQDASGNYGLEQRNSVSICRKSRPNLYLESENSHLLQDVYVINNMFHNNLEQQDLSNENSVVSKSLNHNIIHFNSENKITTIDQWNIIKDENMPAEDCLLHKSSMCTAASLSIASDMSVTVETDVGESIRNHKQHQFESTGCTMSEKDYDSSLCIHITSSQQEDVAMKISNECSKDTEFLVNSETTYHPSLVSVLEAPFQEEILSNTKCFGSVMASLHADVQRQLKFLKPEPLKGYSEGSGMVVSTDDDNDKGIESLKDCEVIDDDSARLFRVEENRDFSYLVDVLTEEGFRGRNQDICSDQWQFPEIQIGPSVFDKLERKYGEQISWNRSARRLLFDRINSGLIELFRPCFGEPMWAKPVARRLSHRQNLKEIEEQLYKLLVSHEKEAIKNSSEKLFGKDDGWLFLGYDVEVICKDIVNLFIDELAAEIVSLESF
ncbi:hypothetical protein Gohar_024641 [Gossypium harknessii]|uniref:DUF4378 domain-containing protein n=1 Tax=Gossypium harknessii TaxID=34285 RepID=A0A7J9HGQ1_9ROSI|nr:hypothetical protein [Gossypium harknessii]